MVRKVSETQVYVTEVDGKFCVITGVKCSPTYCAEMGCDFPNCADIGESFDSLELAKQAYPDLKVA